VGFGGRTKGPGGLKEYLSQHTLAADARMRRGSFNGVFLFVEGPSDERFYGMFTEPKKCQIIIAFNRFNVVEACRILQTGDFEGAIGIIDADFNHLESKTTDLPSVFQTDMHDVECLMLSTEAFDKLVSEFASKEKLATWQDKYVSDIRSHLLDQSIIIGALLWHSNKAGLNLRFQELDPKAYANDEDLRIDPQKLITHVKNKSQRHDLSDEKLLGGLTDCINASCKKHWQMVRGCDLIDLLGFAFRKAIGTLKSLQTAREQIEAGLRLAYLEDDFSRTTLYGEIRKWETSHAPYQVFRKLRQQSLDL
jgi:hypothetical protein